MAPQGGAQRERSKQPGIREAVSPQTSCRERDHRTNCRAESEEQDEGSGVHVARANAATKAAKAAMLAR
jgi:hypothetical protein